MFAKRVAAAHASRDAAVAAMRYQLYLECMPTEELLQLENDRLRRMCAVLHGTDLLHGPYMGMGMDILWHVHAHRTEI